MDALGKVITLAIITVVLVASIGITLDYKNRCDTEQQLDIYTDSDSIRYINGGFGSHNKMIITTNNSIMILDNHYNIGLGNITITIRESKYDNEYKLIDWKYTETKKEVI